MVDVLTIGIAAVVGFGFGGVAIYFVFQARPKRQPEVVARSLPGQQSAAVTVTTVELERSRRDMRTIMVERDLLSSAMMKLYEAESEGRITREEREAISRRYSEQIKDLQSKLKDVELVVEVGELEGLRGELVTLFESKIQNIETRLAVAKQRLGPAEPQPSKKEPPAPKLERVTDLERAVERRAKPGMSESEKRIKEIRDEIEGALTRLEQIDFDKPQEG